MLFKLLSSFSVVLSLLSYSTYLVDYNKRTILPNQELSCGLSFKQTKLIKIAKIIGGHESRSNQYPWLVSLRLKRYKKFNMTHICGGSLIYPQYVLTAAHCVSGENPENLAVVVGINSMTEKLDETNVFNVIKIEYHYLYTKFFNNNDIAVIKLEKRVEFSNKVSTICLPSLSSQTTDLIDKTALTIGWGSTNTSIKDVSMKVQQTDLKILDDPKRCNQIIAYDKAKMYCTIDSIKTLGSSNVCFGDSGGPLMYLSENRWHLFGITSMVILNGTLRSCNPNEPSYFTSIPAYLDFIGYAIEKMT